MQVPPTDLALAVIGSRAIMTAWTASRSLVAAGPLCPKGIVGLVDKAVDVNIAILAAEQWGRDKGRDSGVLVPRTR